MYARASAWDFVWAGLRQQFGNHSDNDAREIREVLWLFKHKKFSGNWSLCNLQDLMMIVEDQYEFLRKHPET